jgi:hypothetical protein
MATINPPPLKVPPVTDPLLRSFLAQIVKFSYLLWNQVGAGTGIVPISGGGTGTDNASAARSNLGLELGVDVQPHDASLDEAVDFFDDTDIAGAEAETLSDGSNADLLHAHSHNSTTGLQGGSSSQYYHLTSAEHAALQSQDDRRYALVVS